MSLIPCSFALVLALAQPALASPQAMNLKDVPEDGRATIIKELARKNTQQQAQARDASDDEGDTGGNKSKSACTMDVGSQSQRSPAQRRTITVVTGPVVQICK